MEKEDKDVMESAVNDILGEPTPESAGEEESSQKGIEETQGDEGETNAGDDAETVEEPDGEPENKVDEEPAKEEEGPAPTPGEDETGDETEPKSFQDRLADFESQSKGLLAAKQAEKEKRKAAEAEAKQLRDEMAQLRKLVEESRKQPEPKPEEKAPERILAEIDDEGNVSLPASVLEQYVKRAMQNDPRLSELQAKVQVAEQMNRQIEAEKAEDAFFAEATKDMDGSVMEARPLFKQVQSALADIAFGYIEAKGIARPVTVLDAVTLYEGTEVEAKFNEYFPGLDMADVILAPASKKYLRRSLETIAGMQNPKPAPSAPPSKDPRKDSERVASITSKARNLTGLNNQVKQEPTTLDALARKSSEDIIFNSTDEEIKALENFLASEG
ncbi:hypothetical protein Dalk_4557 [Desulfatibacillum aliphaticivorans]|uniref:Uncharacterized protein n=1 Tax=Desulfatibacillum aliphaticivorans TaxID=218208 RepID=B8FCS2_DESAL|nr:hypothetical protein [Desulfatibacillum aliphaticivorans]ACL06235.1 hypothetical protein Dalk_4557 [Desulfatibacillum aliphaticivorans]